MSGISRQSYQPLTPKPPAASTAAKDAVPNKPLAPSQSTSSLSPRTPPNQVTIRTLEILPQTSPNLSVNAEIVVSEFAAEVIVDHKHMRSESKTQERVPVLKLDGLPLSESVIDEMVASSGVLEEKILEATDDIHAKKRKETSSRKYAKIVKDVVNIALDVATFIPFAGSVSVAIRWMEYAWEALNRGADVAKKIANRHEPQTKEDGVKRAARVGHKILSLVGKILGFIPGLGVIGGAISLVDDVITLSKDVMHTNTSFV